MSKIVFEPEYNSLVTSELISKVTNELCLKLKNTFDKILLVNGTRDLSRIENDYKTHWKKYLGRQ